MIWKFNFSDNTAKIGQPLTISNFAGIYNLAKMKIDNFQIKRKIVAMFCGKQQS